MHGDDRSDVVADYDGDGRRSTNTGVPKCTRCTINPFIEGRVGEFGIARDERGPQRMPFGGVPDDVERPVRPDTGGTIPRSKSIRSAVRIVQQPGSRAHGALRCEYRFSTP
ncbi:hypothetical protein MAGR_16590 [Mycolicibacterium agri]|uniref:Uncharacterized protein n=1 Tax=Mycolicibacterium agri TaxID=36811 RepID=A0A7I9VYV3_MYCAG|nr:hypothetical protein MAGR_16590 [Mycolicibacterium agri]